MPNGIGVFCLLEGFEPIQWASPVDWPLPPAGRRQHPCSIESLILCQKPPMPEGIGGFFCLKPKGGFLTDIALQEGAHSHEFIWLAFPERRFFSPVSLEISIDRSPSRGYTESGTSKVTGALHRSAWG